jgi:hypothetical protein
LEISGEEKRNTHTNDLGLTSDNHIEGAVYGAVNKFRTPDVVPTKAIGQGNQNEPERLPSLKRRGGRDLKKMPRSHL